MLVVFASYLVGEDDYLAVGNVVVVSFYLRHVKIQLNPPFLSLPTSNRISCLFAGVILYIKLFFASIYLQGQGQKL